MIIRQKKSLSLIETIMVIAVLAVISFLFVPVMSEGIRSWTFAINNEEAMAEITRAVLRMSYDIRNAAEIIVAGGSNIRVRGYGASICREITYVQVGNIIERREQENCWVYPPGCSGADCQCNGSTCIWVNPGSIATFLTPIKALQFNYTGTPPSRVRVRFIYIGKDGREYPEQFSVNLFNRL